MNYKAAVITVSDKGSRGERVDTSGPALCEILKSAGYSVEYTSIIPDERKLISAELIRLCDASAVDLILTTGGTGFAQRDITPEATLDVIERETRGIPEAMRAESMRITPRGCLSRGVAGIRGNTLIINLPGSKKASTENLNAVIGAISHGLDILSTAGSADCAAPESGSSAPVPSADEWLREAKLSPDAGKCGMFLTHNGIVRSTARAKVRDGKEDTAPVKALALDYDEDKLRKAIADAEALPGIYYVRAWINRGTLSVGDSMMLVLVGGDTRPHTVDALDSLISAIKSSCVTEKEIF